MRDKTQPLIRRFQVFYFLESFKAVKHSLIVSCLSIKSRCSSVNLPVFTVLRKGSIKFSSAWSTFLSYRFA